MTCDEPRESRGVSQAEPAEGQEILSFQRRGDLPGVEVRSLTNSAREFHGYSTDFEFFVPTTWRGEVWHRRRQLVLGPGTVLSAHPGEVFVARRVTLPGTGHFLTIEGQAFREYLTDHPLPSSKLQLRAFTKLSNTLQEKLLHLIDTLRPGPSTLAIQSAMLAFVHGLSAELLEESTSAATSIAFGLSTADRMRECLHYDTSATLDLSTLAREAGVSRYQALRLFKRHYGLPPHTYQLSVRLALAQKALREGQRPVHVAAQYGFVDQSHFTRHFKRLLGVTPAQYARAGGCSRALHRHALPDTVMSSASRFTGYGRPAQSLVPPPGVGPSSADP